MTSFITFSLEAPDQRKPQCLLQCWSGWADVSEPPLLFLFFLVVIPSSFGAAYGFLFILSLHTQHAFLALKPPCVVPATPYLPQYSHLFQFLFTPLPPPPSLLPIFVCVICFWRPFWFVLFVCFCFFCWELWFFLASSVITLFSFFVASPLLAACLKLFHEPMHDSNHANFKWFKVWYDFFLSFFLKWWFHFDFQMFSFFFSPPSVLQTSNILPFSPFLLLCKCGTVRLLVSF